MQIWPISDPPIITILPPIHTCLPILLFIHILTTSSLPLGPCPLPFCLHYCLLNSFPYYLPNCHLALSRPLPPYPALLLLTPLPPLHPATFVLCPPFLPLASLPPCLPCYLRYYLPNCLPSILPPIHPCLPILLC